MINERPSGKNGFSLIELLAAMAILMIIVTLMGTIFTNSDRVWAIGTGRANNNSDGRAALTMIAHDLQYAVADDILTFNMNYAREDTGNGWPRTTYGFENSELSLVSLQHNSSGSANRTAREIQYYLKEDSDKPHVYRLRRSYSSKALNNGESPNDHCYWKRDWFESRTGSGDYLAENVVGLAFYAWDPIDKKNYRRCTTAPEYYNDPSKVPASEISEWLPLEHVDTSVTPFKTTNLCNNRLPAFIDVYLEILNEDDSERAASMADSLGEDHSDVKDFVDKNTRRYTTRVFFHNRHGYKIRSIL